jgi:uncharacterized protein (TIGR03067 family)
MMEADTAIATPVRQQGSDARAPRRTRRLAVLALVVVIAAVAVWFFFLRGPRNDLERFGGDWQVTVAERVTPNVFRVRGDRWQSYANGIDGPAYRITLNETANPREMDLELMDASNIRGPVPRMHGIYAFDGDEVRVRMNDATQPRPTPFDDPDAIVCVLRRVTVEEVPHK